MSGFLQRYFVLTADGVLKYYKDLDDFLNNEPWQGSLVVFGANIEEEKVATSDSSAEHRFSVIDAFGRRLDCAVDTASDMSAWVKVLRRKAHGGEEVKQPEVLCEGIVFKRGQFNPMQLRLNPWFQKRYFVLTSDGWLKNYKNEDDFKQGISVGAMLCQNISLEEDVGMSISGRLFCFRITPKFGTSARRTLLSCSSSEERFRWVVALREMQENVNVHRVERDTAKLTQAERDELEFLYGQDALGSPQSPENVRATNIEDLLEDTHKDLMEVRRFHGKFLTRLQHALMSFEDSQAFNVLITFFIMSNVAFMAGVRVSFCVDVLSCDK